MKKINLRNYKFNKKIIVLVLILILSFSYFIVKANIKEKVKNQQAAAKIDKSKTTTKEEKVLDCAKKLAVNSDLTSEKTQTSSCLFMGCGDFFQ